MTAEEHRQIAISLQRSARAYHEISVMIMDRPGVAASDQRIAWRYHRESRQHIEAWLVYERDEREGFEGPVTRRMRAVAVIAGPEAKNRVLTDAIASGDEE